MVNVQIEKIADVAVVHCEGRIVHSDAAFRLRDAVTRQTDSRVILLDLSDAKAVEGGGLGMLVFLHRWCHDQEIQLKLFDPPARVRRSLERASPSVEFEIVGTDEVLSLLDWEGRSEPVVVSQENRELVTRF
jgi:anti-anti-sigma regulatory factor